MLRVGVTGHRALADPDAVAREVESVLDRLAPGGAPIEVISPLAEGADRLVVRCVLARHGSSLIVPLPLPVEDYLNDFAASRADFVSLLGEADEVFVVDGRSAAGLPDDRTPAGDRTAAYERVGRWVVDACDVLLALWDEGPSGGRGGTAEIVDYAHERGVAVETVVVRRG